MKGREGGRRKKGGEGGRAPGRKEGREGRVSYAQFKLVAQRSSSPKPLNV